MQKFEFQLCTTVDAILNILGHNPRMTREKLDEIAPLSTLQTDSSYPEKSTTSQLQTDSSYPEKSTHDSTSDVINVAETTEGEEILL